MTLQVLDEVVFLDLCVCEVLLNFLLLFLKILDLSLVIINLALKHCILRAKLFLSGFKLAHHVSDDVLVRLLFLLRHLLLLLVPVSFFLLLLFLLVCNSLHFKEPVV